MTEQESGMAIPKRGPVIAIDGPAGTGKSSVTKRLAEALGFVHVDTGALYRSVALLTLESLRVGRAGADELTLDSFSAQELGDRAAQVAREVNLEFRRQPKKNPANRVFANGRDVTELIRTPEISMGASKVSAHPSVRLSLLGLQRRLGCVGRTILEGRDIGTVIFPDADVKFYLTASVEERAKRRLTELETSGADAPSFDEVKRQIALRDDGDTRREVAPLRKAQDAIEVDTSSLTLDQVVTSLEATARARLGGLL